MRALYASILIAALATLAGSAYGDGLISPPCSGSFCAATAPLSVTLGGTGANLSATGGASQVLFQTSVGGAVTVARPACATLSDASAFCSGTDAAGLTGTVASARISGSYTGITGVGTLTAGTIGSGFTAIANSALANSATTVNGQTCTLGSACTAAAAAGTLTGATLAAGVTASSLTSVGTLTGLAVSGTIHTTVDIYAAGTIQTNGANRAGIDFSGGAARLYGEGPDNSTTANFGVLLAAANGSGQYTIISGAGATGILTLNTTAYPSCTAFTTDASAVLSGTCVSAKRFKDTRAPLSASAADLLDSLEAGVWTYKDQKKYGTDVHVSLYADDVAKMDPRCAMYDKDGLPINYTDRCVDTYIVAAWKADHAMIAQLEKRIAVLEKRK